MNPYRTYVVRVLVPVLRSQLMIVQVRSGCVLSDCTVSQKHLSRKSLSGFRSLMPSIPLFYIN